MTGIECKTDSLLCGIEIGGTKLQIVCGDSSGQITTRRRFTVNANEGGAGIRRQLEETLPSLFREFPVKAVGVGFGGPVDWQTGRICCSHQVEGWSEFDIKGWLESVGGRPVKVDNDANVASLGEATYGAGREANPAFYVTMGSGVGGGLVVDGRIYHGAKPGEAEIGHIRLDRQGSIVETCCSGWAVDAKIRRLKDTGTPSVLTQLAGDQRGGESRYLAQALLQGDAAARKILADTAEDLAFGLSHVVHLFHPAVIVLGGGLSLVGEPLRAAVESALPQFVMKAFHPAPAVRVAALGEDAVPMGALQLASRL